MDFIKLVQKSYKSSLASSKVLNCLSCGRGDAKFEDTPLYIKDKNSNFFINRLPNTRNRHTKFKKPRGQSAYVVNHRIQIMGNGTNFARKSAKDMISQQKIVSNMKENKRPQTGIPKKSYKNEVEVDVGKFIWLYNLIVRNRLFQQ